MNLVERYCLADLQYVLEERLVRSRDPGRDQGQGQGTDPDRGTEREVGRDHGHGQVPEVDIKLILTDLGSTTNLTETKGMLRILTHTVE